MGSEDFAYMLQEKPGCYLLLGTASPMVTKDLRQERNIKLAADEDYFSAKDVPLLHEPTYDFNDEVITDIKNNLKIIENYISHDRLSSLIKFLKFLYLYLSPTNNK